MLQKLTFGIVLIAVLAGLLGGVASQQFGMTVLAQQGPVEKIEAQEFRLVDADGKMLGVLKAVPAPIERGKPIIIGDQTNGGIVLYDKLGRVVWAAPQPEPAARFQPLTQSK